MKANLTHLVCIGLFNITNSIPDSFTIANTQVAVPLVQSLQSFLKTIVNIAVGTSTTMMVLLVTACIAASFTAVGSGSSYSLYLTLRLPRSLITWFGECSGPSSLMHTY